MSQVVWSEAEQESLEQLAEALAATDDVAEQLELATQWYRWLTQEFTASVEADDLINIRQVLEGYFTNQELIHIVGYDINSPEKIIIFLADLESDQDSFNQLMTYYFSETACTQGYEPEIKFNAVAFYTNFSLLGHFIMQAPAEIQQCLYPLYVKEAIQTVKVDDLKALSAYSPEKMAAVLSGLGPELATECAQLFEVTAVSVAKNYLPRMQLGDIDAETAALICAALADTKNYQFRPVIVEAAELESFVQLLSAYQHELVNQSVYFIVAGVHWVSGRIDFHANGCNVCLADSFGADGGSIMGSLFKMSYLAQQHLAGVKVYVLDDARQNATAGCSVYAIDDVHHLHTIERYLPAAYANGGLFAYLAAHSQPTQLNNQLSVQLAQTPLPFLRSMQSRHLFAEIQKRGHEATIPVNKRGEMAQESVERHFYKVEGRDRNKRIEYKLEIYRNKTLKFLSRYDDAMATEKMLGFSLDVLEDSLKSLQPQNNRVTTLGA